MARTLGKRRFVAGWLLGAALGSVAILPLCDLHFDCGCTWPGLGGYAHCDIHTAGPPDCPWCERPSIWIAGMAFSYALALAGAWGVGGRFPFVVVTLVSLAGTLGGTLLAGIATSLALGRPPLAGL